MRSLPRRLRAAAVGDLILRRVHADGRINDLWSIRTAATDGALARGPKRTHVVWPEGSVLRIVTRPDGGIPAKPRTARVALRDGYVSLDLAVDRRARLVAAVGSSVGGTLVASLTPRGTVLAPYPALGDKIALGAWVVPDPSNPDEGTAYLAKCTEFDEAAFSAFFSAYQFQGPERFPPDSLLPGRS